MSPIDFNWHMLDTVEATITTLSKHSNQYGDTLSFDDLNNFLTSWNDAKKLAKDNSWEGDFREPPRVFWIPDDQEFVYGFVWKQDNNGSTFVVSPYPLNHLKEHTF